MNKFVYLFGIGGLMYGTYKMTINEVNEIDYTNYVYMTAKDLNNKGLFKHYIDPILVLAMVKQESAFNQKAERYESDIKSKYSLFVTGDKSIGFMQVLSSTANWLNKDMGYRSYKIETSKDLLAPVTNIYFGMSYIDYLLSKDSQLTIQKIAEYYNGGYGNSNTQTRIHAEKVIENYRYFYNKFKERL